MAQLGLVSDFGFPLGFSYLHALIDILSGREAYETFSIVTAVGLSLSVLGYATAARYLFGAGRFGSILVALLTALSPILMGVHYDDFGMHVLSLGLIPVTFATAVLSLTKGQRLPLLGALLLSAAFSTYPPAAFVFVLGPLIFYTALRSVQNKSRIVPILSNLLMLIGFAVLFNLPGVVHAGKFFVHMLNLGWITQYGNVTQYIPWTEIYGFSHHLLTMPQSSLWWPLPLMLITLLVSIYGLWRMKRGNGTAVVAMVAVYVGFVLWNRYWLDFPYGFFKALTFATFPTLGGLALGFEACLKGRHIGVRPLIRVISVATLALMIGINGANLVALSASVVPLSREFPSLRALGELRELVRSGETIHIRDAKDTPMWWMIYFLRDYELSLRHRTPYDMGHDWPSYQEAITTDFAVVDKAASLPAPWAAQVVYENSRYQLLRKQANILSHLDFQTEEQPLQPQQSIQLEIFGDHVVIGDRSFSLGEHVDLGEVLRLGVLAPAGALVRFGPANLADTTRLTEDVTALDWPMWALPTQLTLTNEGTRPVWLQGWLEIVKAGADLHRAQQGVEIFARPREEVIPHSGVFEIIGWHALEEGQRRWTQKTAFARFRNPHKPTSLEVAGVNQSPSAGIAAAHVSIRLNGYTLKEVNSSGAFRQSYLLSEELLGHSGWGDLEITANRTFNPKQLGLSEDARDFGVQITTLALHDLELGPDGLIDIGTDAARKYLGPSWSNDEQGEGFSYAWANAQESRLWMALSEVSAFEMEMRVFPLSYPGAPPQELRVYVNDRHLQDFVLDGQWQTFSLQLPAACLSPGINTFRFVYGYAVSAADVLPGSSDPRTLAVAFDYIRFRPE
jgi:hypothetical protein